ncbi:MAG TPA: hypothetical protein VF779_05615 [Pyrinomonadaceae bacterium]
MKRFSIRLLGAIVLMSAPLFLPAALAQGKNYPPAKSGKARTESHPQMRRAIAALEAAKLELEQTSGDFGGHKVEAIEAVNNALKRLRLALQFDKY